MQKRTKGDLATLRGYDRDDLNVVAEIARGYLFSGSPDLALVLFEGLAALVPSEAYYALALGTTFSELGDRRAAHHWYARAAELDPLEPRADINRGQLYLEAGDHDRASRCLRRGASKARRQRNQPLHAKATAIVAYIENRRTK